MSYWSRFCCFYCFGLCFKEVIKMQLIYTHKANIIDEKVLVTLLISCKSKVKKIKCLFFKKNYAKFDLSLKNPIEIVSPVSRFSTPHKPSNEVFKLHWRNHLCMEINHRCHRIEMHQKIYMVTWIHMIDLEEEMTFQQFWLELQSTYLTCFKFISFFPFPFVTIKPIVKLGVQTIRHVYI